MSESAVLRRETTEPAADRWSINILIAMKTSEFQQALELVERLSLEDQEILLDLLQKRLNQAKRTKLSQDIKEVRQEFAQGNVQFGSVEEFLAEMDQP